MKLKGILEYSSKGNEDIYHTPISVSTSNEFLEVCIEEYLNPLRVKVVLKPKSPVIIKTLYLEIETVYNKESKIMVNGYETWTESREFIIDESIPPLSDKLLSMKSQGDYGFYRYSGEKGILHSYSYTYIRKGEEFDFTGSMLEDSGNTIFEHHTKEGFMRIIKDCNGVTIDKEYIAFDLLCIRGTEKFIFDSYFNFFNSASKRIDTCTGWTSWYYYYNKINEKVILENLANFSNNNIPIDIFQIDDGYENAVGDWIEPNHKFKCGMKYIADRIKQCGYKAGIWIAPFICERNSNVFRKHFDWILKDKEGNPIQAGFNSLWSGEYYTLDFYNQEFKGYLREVFKCVLKEWKYDIVKLDFLYAISVKPRVDKTRGQIMREAMIFLREICGDKVILGCGVPLAAAIGLVEYCRVGSDVALFWEDEQRKNLNFRERNSTFNSLISTIGRRGLNGRAFLNDPDVFILRSTNNEMCFNQRYSMFLINNIFGGLVFTSDNVSEYTKEEMELYLSSFPLKQKEIKSVLSEYNKHKIEFSIGNRNYIALSNLDAEPYSFNIENGIYFNTKERCFIKCDNILLQPYESLCLLKVKKVPYEVIGDNCCLFSGSQIERIKIDSKEVTIEFNERFVNEGQLFLSVPEDFNEIIYKGNNYVIENVKSYEEIKYIIINC